MTDWGYLAHQAADAHLDACHDALWCDSETGQCDLPHPPGQHPSPASAPFCDCQTCLIRETLHAAYPYIVNAVREEYIDGVASSNVEGETT